MDPEVWDHKNAFPNCQMWVSCISVHFALWSPLVPGVPQGVLQGSQHWAVQAALQDGSASAQLAPRRVGAQQVAAPAEGWFTAPFQASPLCSAGVQIPGCSDEDCNLRSLQDVMPNEISKADKWHSRCTDAREEYSSLGGLRDGHEEAASVW